MLMHISQSRSVFHRFELRPFADQKFNFSPKRERQDQNIGKQNCSVETEASHRLQSHFGCQFRIEAKV